MPILKSNRRQCYLAPDHKYKLAEHLFIVRDQSREKLDQIQTLEITVWTPKMAGNLHGRRD